MKDCGFVQTCFIQVTVVYYSFTLLRQSHTLEKQPCSSIIGVGDLTILH